MKACWKRIENFPDYEVSDDGQVRSLKFNKIRILSQRALGVKRRYRGISLWKNGKETACYVHRLVLESFKGHPPSEDMEVNHIDCNKSNNILSNLEWTTSSQNKYHGVKNGLYPKGEECSWSKLTAEDVKAIKQMRASGMSQQAISDKVSVGRRQVGRILQGTRWKDYGI